MMKKVVSLTLALCLALSLSVSALAADNSMENFKKTATYSNQFTDVESTYWAAPSVKTCYEYGFMKGATATTFSPKGDLTVAEAIVMADRLHEIYTTGESTLVNGTPWYQPYVDYAVKNGIVAAGDFTDYTAKATRAQMAYIFCNALPESVLPAVNKDQTIPDVTSTTTYAKSIQTLYAAGVLTGSDVYGTFHPNNNIIRAEAATILARMALPTQRKTVVLLKQVTYGTSGIVLAVPQTAVESTSGSVYMILSEEDTSGAIVNSLQDAAYKGVSISVLPESTMNATLVESFTASGMTLSQTKSSLVTFGAIKAYRTTGNLSDSEGSADCVIYTYISGDQMYLIALLAHENDAALQNMANNLQVSGVTVSPKL